MTYKTHLNPNANYHYSPEKILTESGATEDFKYEGIMSSRTGERLVFSAVTKQGVKLNYATPALF